MNWTRRSGSCCNSLRFPEQGRDGACDPLRLRGRGRLEVKHQFLSLSSRQMKDQSSATTGLGLVADRYRRTSRLVAHAGGPADTNLPSLSSSVTQLSGSQPTPWPATTMALSASDMCVSKQRRRL